MPENPMNGPPFRNNGWISNCNTSLAYCIPMLTLNEAFCGAHNASKTDQGNLLCARSFWEVRYVTDRVASKRGVRAEAFPANQRSISLQLSFDFI
ncbi:hypothetical protein ACTXT7_010149 [Hymenolepis weldensis]